MRVVSVNVGLPREVHYKGKRVVTGIFKEPVEGHVMLRTPNLDGDRQADLTVHGGPNKAVYAYPAEHYVYWQNELPDLIPPWGVFGENLTTEGLTEQAVNIGDRFRVGSAELAVTQPRLPCYKLGVRFGREEIIRRFLHSRRTGFYFAVLREGEVGAGDTIELLRRDAGGLSVADITRLYVFERGDRAGLSRAVEAETLPESWRNYFQNRLEKLAESEEKTEMPGEEKP